MSQELKDEIRVTSAAATKIQANFRGYRVRKQLKKSIKGEVKLLAEQKGATHETGTVTLALSTSMDTDENSNAETSISVDRKTEEVNLKKQKNVTHDLEEKSATKIQAGVRGFLVRKRQHIARTAATKIQASFRGFRARKLLKQNGQ